MIFILDNIRSKFNIGSMFRTWDAFWLELLVLTWYSKYPPDTDISKTAIWAETVVKWKYFQQTIEALLYFKNKWRKIISIEIDKNSKSIFDCEFNWNEVFIFWNEIIWINKDILNLSDEIIEIPICWKIKESLNVWVSAWIVWSIVKMKALQW